MRLGELLVRDRRITEAQLAEAMASQARDGGRIGSLLLEMGLVDPETLTIYLGLELGLPVATGSTLERCKRSAVTLLKPEQAAKFLAVPIVIQGQTLLVAMSDPHDLATLDAIAATTGYRVIPRVAPEVRIYYYLERYYGVPRPARFARYGESARGAVVPRDDLPGPPLPGLPPAHETPMSSGTSDIKIRKLVSGTNPQIDRSSLVASEAAQLSQTLANNDADFAETVELDPDEEVVETWGSDISQDASVAQPLAPTPRLSFEEALGKMQKAENRGDIAEALLGFAAGMFDAAILFLVKDQIAFGWKGFGPDMTADRIETLLVPLEAPSIFQNAAHQNRMFRGRPSPSAIHNHLFKVMRNETFPHCTVCIIEINGRPVNVLYGERRAFGPPPDEETAVLRKLMNAAEEAYVRLISVHKRKSGDTNAPETSAN